MTKPTRRQPANDEDGDDMLVDDDGGDDAVEDSGEDAEMKQDPVEEESGADDDDAKEEEKMNGADNDEELGEQQHRGQQHHHNENNNNTFLDSFYGLSSPDPHERARAGQRIVQYCLLDPATANAKDAEYTLSRLLNGLCSGRAAARQGNASCLASFLRIACIVNNNTEQQGDNNTPVTIESIQREYVASPPPTSTTRDADTKDSKDQQQQHYLTFLRDRLLRVTGSSSGGGGDDNNNAGGGNNNKNHHANAKRSGSGTGAEERDARFGRLFGILAIVRSGILLPQQKSNGDSTSDDPLDVLIRVCTDYVDDLIELYQYKKWMREPATHAIGTLLNSFYDCLSATAAHDNDNNDNYETVVITTTSIIQHLIEHVIVPKLLVRGANDPSPSDSNNDKAASPLSLFATYSVEQIALVANIQARHPHNDNMTLPAPIHEPILTGETIPLLAQALSETSCVTQPRMHLVWDTIWTLITEPVSASDDDAAESVNSNSRMSAVVDVRKLRSCCPLTDKETGERIPDVIDSLLNHVVCDKLLGIGSGKDNNNKSKTTHERRALALCVVRNLMGLEFVSSIAGRTRLIIDPHVIEHVVLQPQLVQRLFLDVIGAGGGGGGSNKKNHQQASHLLKPLALQILESVLDELSDTEKEEQQAKRDGGNYSESVVRRLAIGRALLRADARFDARTKTTIVNDLFMITLDHNRQQPTKPDQVCRELWEHYLSFLEEQVATTTDAAVDGTIAYADRISNMGKLLLRVESTMDEDESHVVLFLSTMIQRTLGFCMAAAFFDTGSLRDGKGSPVLNAALEFRSKRCNASSAAPLLPYEVRSVMSARFFSLLAEGVSARQRSPRSGKDGSTVYRLLSDMVSGRRELEESGAIGLGLEREQPDDDDSDEEPLSSPEAVVGQFYDIVKEFSDIAESDTGAQAKKRCAVGLAALAHTLYLHSLSCGQSDDMAGLSDPDVDDDSDAEEVTEAMNDLIFVWKQCCSVDDESNVDENPLRSLAELCANVLLSPLGAGNQSRGASPTLLKEAVKMAWSAGLNLATTAKSASLDSSVIDLLLSSIGAASGESPVPGEEDEEADASEDEGDNDADETENDAVFSSASQLPEVRDDSADKASGDQTVPNEIDKDDDSDIEIDPNRLQSMLEEDDDMDVDEGVLEHHEGADAALAKLLKIKQEARKAGQLSLERLELARQIRCTLLLDTLFAGRKENLGSLLHADTVLQLMTPLIRYRRELDMALLKVADHGSTSSSAEKRALLERITSLLKTKIFKVKFATLPWSESVDAVEVATSVATNLMLELKRRGSKEHQSCCSTGLVTVLRSLADAEAKTKLASDLYEDALSEWGTKRTSTLQASLFEDLVHQYAVVAQAALPTALAGTASNARDSFLKSESFRMISLLYNPKLNPNASDLDKLALQRAIDAADAVVQSVAVNLKDAEMRQAKRMREVLKALEKTVDFLLSCRGYGFDKVPRPHMDDVVALLGEVKGASDSQAVKQACEKCLRDIAKLRSPANEDGSLKDGDPRQNIMDNTEETRSDEADLEKTDSHESPKKKKSKKKSKKEKKKKRKR